MTRKITAVTARTHLGQIIDRAVDEGSVMAFRLLEPKIIESLSGAYQF